MIPLVQAILSEVRDLSINPWFGIGQSLFNAGNEVALSPEDRNEFEAEIKAFRLMRVNEERNAPFAYTFPELLWVDKTQEVKPPLLDQETIDYWRARAGEESHPLLRARYADLVWELERYAAPSKPRDYVRARVAITGYLEGVRAGRASHPVVVNELLDRALDIAANLRDASKVGEIIDELLARAENAPPQGYLGIWLHPAKTLLKGKLLTQQQRERIRLELEKRFAAVLSEDDGLAADLTLPYLLSLYSKQIDLPEKHRLLIRYAAMHRRIAKTSSPLIAVTSLLPIVDLFDDNGLPAEADELRLYVEEISPRVEEGMQEMSFNQSIEIAKVDKYFEPLLATDYLFVALYRVAKHTIPKVNEVRSILAEARRDYPIQFLVTRVSFGHSGLPVTQTGSADEHPDAHLSMYYRHSLSMTGLFFQFGWERLVGKFGFDAAGFAAAIGGTPLIQEGRSAFFLEGLKAHFDKDYLKAVHILVPQVENMLRELLRLLGIPRSKRVRTHPGVTELKTMGEVLWDQRVVGTLEEDLHFFLTHLYVEKHGLNLRNDLSHGIAPPNVFTQTVSGMVIQSIILLSAIRPESIHFEQTAPDNE
jgi:hypothetical protein